MRCSMLMIYYMQIKTLVEECKEESWMFAFIGAGEEVVKEATTISITNTIVWEKSSEGTEAMFTETNSVSTRFFDKMAAMCDASTSADERIQMRKKFSEDYYNS